MENKQTKKQIFGEVFRFLLVGGFATLVDYFVFFLFNSVLLKNISSQWNTIISTFFGFVAGLIINWIFSARFVYRYEKKTTKKQFILYVIICVTGLFITEIGMFAASPLFEKLIIHVIVDIDFWKWFFKVLMTIIVLVFNYFGRKYLIFKK